MFGLGIPEIVLILVVALLFLGPDKLPEVAKSLGKGLREFRKITDDVRDSVNHTVAEAAREVIKPPVPPAVDPAHVPPAPLEQAAAAPPSPTPENPLVQPVAEERVSQPPRTGQG